MTRRMAFYDLRDWWLSNPRVKEILKMDPGDQYGPIYPAAKQPESSVPYIVYDVMKNVFVNAWWLHFEQIEMRIFTENIEDTTELMNIFIDYSSRGDESAQELNRFLADNNKTIDFEHHSIIFFNAEEASAPVEQGGSSATQISFVMQYSPISGTNIAS